MLSLLADSIQGTRIEKGNTNQTRRALGDIVQPMCSENLASYQEGAPTERPLHSRTNCEAEYRATGQAKLRENFRTASGRYGRFFITATENSSSGR